MAARDAAAQKELATGLTAAGMSGLGDAWWDIAQKEKGTAQEQSKQRALKWYREAAAGGLTGLALGKVQKRIEKLDSPAAPVAPVALSEVRKPADPPAAQAAGGQVMDLLTLADPASGPPNGDWKWTRNGLSGSVWRAPLEIPVATQGQDDLHVEFTRLSGDTDINVIVPVGPSQTMVFISGNNGQTTGLLLVDGQPWGHAVPITNGHRYSMDVEVRTDGQKAAIKATLDGAVAIHWQGAVSSLSLRHQWKIPDNSAFGLGAAGAPVIFHTLQLRMISGHAAPLKK